MRDKLFRHRHSALLAAIVVSFVVRPLVGESQLAGVLFSLALLVVLIVALYAIQVDELVGDREVLVAQRKRQRIIAATLAAAATLERVSVLLSPSPRLYLIGSISWLAFFAFVTWTEFRTVLKQKEVTGETISMAISVYLLLGVTWALLYIVIFQLQPESFSFGASPVVAVGTASQEDVFPTFVYFSLSTLATIGFGDIAPLTLRARYAAVAEGITGQFYLAVLVARLVAMQMSRSQK